MRTFLIFVLTMFVFGFIGCDKKEKKMKKLGGIITNVLGDVSRVESGGQSVDLSNNECVKVSGDQLAKLKVSKVVTVGSAIGSAVICDSSDTDTNNNCPSNIEKSYKIMAKSGIPPWEIQEADTSDSTNCKTLLK